MKSIHSVTISLLLLIPTLLSAKGLPPTSNSQLPSGCTWAGRNYAISAGALYTYNIYSSQLNRTMQVDIWTPDGYPQANHNYPVLYMHDGQNCIKPAAFSNRSWEVDKTITRLKGEIDQPIVVMVYCQDQTRNQDYIPANWWNLLPDGQNSITIPGENTVYSPNSKKYIDYLTETLKPFVDTYFQTATDQTHTVVAGSSMGALVSVYAVQYRPDVFGAAIAMSYPSLGEWWSWQLQTFVQQMPEANSVRLYIDTGTGELDDTFFPYFYDITPVLQCQGWDTEHLWCPIYPGANHSEGDWAARLETPLRYVFK